VDLFQKECLIESSAIVSGNNGKASGNPVVQYHFGMAQFKNGDRLKAKKALAGVF